MRPGKLNYRVRLERHVEIVSNTGSRSADWQLFKEVAAEMAPASGREFSTDDALRDTRTVVWRIRWAPELKAQMSAKWRIVYGTQIYNVLDIDPQGRGGRKDMVELVCRIGADRG
ncbi:MAG: phage head closure protein [Shewanella sp.]